MLNSSRFQCVTCRAFMSQFNCCHKFQITFLLQNVYLNLIMTVLWSTEMGIYTSYRCAQSKPIRSHIAGWPCNIFSAPWKFINTKKRLWPTLIMKDPDITVELLLQSRTSKNPLFIVINNGIYSTENIDISYLAYLCLSRIWCTTRSSCVLPSPVHLFT